MSARSASLPERAARYAWQRLQPALWSLQYVRAGPWLRDRIGRSRLRLMSETELRDARRSDTGFVFGSGASLRELSASDWAHVARHGTVGFNYFIRQRWVRLDYHLVGEVATGDDLDRSRWLPALQEYVRLLEDNPCCAETILGLQEGWAAYQSNRLSGLGLLPATRRVFRYRKGARGILRPPARSLREGLVHGAGSVCVAVNLAYALGFRRIVLAGVDLYDSRYFWVEDDAPRPDLVALGRADPAATHSTASALVPYLGRWRELLSAEGVELTVLNPRSLLAEVLPVYRIPAGERDAS